MPLGTMLPVIDKLDEDAAPVVTVVVSGDRDLREVTERFGTRYMNVPPGDV